MSRVSVTGSKAVMDDAVEAIHRMDLLHVTDYDGSWEGFSPGDPVEGADEASELLVTVRSLESILGITEEEAGPTMVLDREEVEAELEEVRQRANELDDRRDDLEDRLRALGDRIETARPFAELGIDLDLLSGYDSLSVAVGEGDEEAVRRAVMEAGGIDAFETFAAPESGVVAVFARTDEETLDDALVGVEFAAIEVPDPGGIDEAVGEHLDSEGGVDPEAYLAALRQRRREVESRLDTVENEIEDLRHEVGDFLLAAEEALTVEVQRREAPLSFATTENAFVAEGWIPTERYVDLAEGLYDAVGDHVDVDELECAAYDGEGQLVDREDVTPGTPGPGEPTAADGGTDAEARADGGDERVATDGGETPMSESEPPVIQDNPEPVRPFEALVRIINRPKYSELDPTVIIFLTFPTFFGFMIGDLGYGLLYLVLGYWITQRFEGDVIRSLGAIGMWCGGFTALFGVLYGEVFGLHVLGDVVWGGNPPMHKGLQPHFGEYARLWLVVSLLLGIAHLTVGWVFDLYENVGHDLEHAVTESGSWLLMLFGVWVWVLADAPPTGAAPPVLVGSESVLASFVGFAGFPSGLGLAGLAVFGVGLVLLLYGEPLEVVEFLNVLVNVLSYTRIAAVLLAKAGMAFVVNLLVFGAYEHNGEWHFIFTHGALEHAREEGYEVIFSGLVTGEGPVALLLGLLAGAVIVVLGHLLVLALGVTSAGLQAVRLEYVEFFSKFYEGGGDAYEPFGLERRYTTEE